MVEEPKIEICRCAECWQDVKLTQHDAGKVYEVQSPNMYWLCFLISFIKTVVNCGFISNSFESGTTELSCDFLSSIPSCRVECLQIIPGITNSVVCDWQD